MVNNVIWYFPLDCVPSRPTRDLISLMKEIAIPLLVSTGVFAAIDTMNCFESLPPGWL